MCPASTMPCVTSPQPSTSFIVATYLIALIALFAAFGIGDAAQTRKHTQLAAGQVKHQLLRRELKMRSKRTNTDESLERFEDKVVPAETTAMHEANSALKDLSDMLPSSNAQCISSNGSKEEPTHVAEVNFCLSRLRKHEQAGNCIIYNFGVGHKDAFLSYMGSSFKGCKVYAFDPTVSNKTWAKEGGPEKVFGPNVVFHSWGLYGGTGPRKMDWSHPIYGKVTGELYTLREILEMLGHSGQVERIAMLRADCEGCEWEWVPKQMKDDPNIFSRIDQMFTEIHFASTLRFNKTFIPQAPVLRKMLMDNFNVLHHHENLGYRPDQNKVPAEAVAAGVKQGPCCREFSLVSKHGTN